MTSLDRVPASLQKELRNYSLRMQNNAAALFDLLDRRPGPVKVDEIRDELGFGPTDYKNARDLLMQAVPIYITQEGITLRSKVPSDEQRYWHLAWSLGLFEISGKQLTLDRDLLQRVPGSIIKLFNEGRLADGRRLSKLRTRTREALGIMLEVVSMYRDIDRALGIALLPEVSGTEWKKTLQGIKRQLKAAS